MIEGLENVLAGSGQPGLDELRGVLQELLDGDGATCRFVDQQTLQPRQMRVFRLRFAIDGQPRSLVVKRLKPEIARRNELVARRWLPAIGLSGSGPPVRGSAAERSGACVWHVYDDLGEFELDARQPAREAVASAVALIARMHTRFAGHALLGEVRLNGGDSGIHFYESNVRDALCALDGWRPVQSRIESPESGVQSPESRVQGPGPGPGPGPGLGTLDVAGLRGRLMERLGRLRDELPARARAQADWGGPETLLHGDLWAINVFVIPGPDGLRARLIDWDHAAAGPAGYDLSTFLMRFPAEHRCWVLELYREAVAEAGWQLPGERELNFLFETHEYARFANHIIWPAIALAMDHGEWGVAALAEVEQWFQQYAPVLPVAAGKGCECQP
jgi:thiamine kinase-like enzyme